MLLPVWACVTLSVLAAFFCLDSCITTCAIAELRRETREMRAEQRRQEERAVRARAETAAHLERARVDLAMEKPEIKGWAA